MAKSHSFSIYLLKKGFTPEKSLSDEHGLSRINGASSISKRASLFVRNNPPTSPWWRDYLGIEQDLDQSLKSALLFVPVKGRYFVLCFGHAYSKIDDSSYEYDFGLRVTLNSIVPNKLNSTDTVEPINGRRKRTQIPNASDITMFDFDKDSSILRNITGRVKDDYKDLFTNPSGASSIRISSSVSADKISELLRTLLELYNPKTYEDAFHSLLNIIPVKDSDQIAKLDENLIIALKEKSENLYLTIPEIIDYHQVSSVRFKSRKKSETFDDLYLDRYYEYLEHIEKNLNEVELEDIQKQMVSLIGTDEETESSYQLYKCLVFDTKLQDEGGAFHLNEGHWYKVSDDYLNKLTKYLDRHCKKTKLPPYNHKDEAAYNKSVPLKKSKFICLDSKNIAPSGQMEPCDLYTVDSDEALFIHVKHFRDSAGISHLLYQGQNSARAIRSIDKCLQKLHRLLKGKSKNLPLKKSDKFKVCFAIITHKDITKKSENLPIFSKISLMQALENLENMGLEAWYEYIKNKKPKKKR